MQAATLLLHSRDQQCDPEGAAGNREIHKTVPPLSPGFLLRTDHGSLACLFCFKHPEGQLALWLKELSQYDFDIEHRTGAQHSNVDALSRQATEGLKISDCYQVGMDVTELPCKGCSHCQRLHKQ